MIVKSWQLVSVILAQTFAFWLCDTRFLHLEKFDLWMLKQRTFPCFSKPFIASSPQHTHVFSQQLEVCGSNWQEIELAFNSSLHDSFSHKMTELFLFSIFFSYALASLHTNKRNLFGKQRTFGQFCLPLSLMPTFLVMFFLSFVLLLSLLK